MKLKISVTTNLKTREVMNKVNKASEKGLKNVIIDIANDVIKGSPVKFGHNRRSIAYKAGSKVTALGTPQGKEKPFKDWEPETKELEGAVYSTSGYGGYLEVGTYKMIGRPYFKPAYDKHFKELPKEIEKELR